MTPNQEPIQTFVSPLAVEPKHLVNPMFIECLKKLNEVRDLINDFYNDLSEPNQGEYRDEYNQIDDTLGGAVYNISQMLSYDTANLYYWKRY